VPQFTIRVNGTSHTVDASADTPLLWVLRDRLGLTGTKYSCGAGWCGTCTVLIGKEAVRSCNTRIDEVGKREGSRARLSVRILPARADHECRRAADGKSQPVGPGDRRRNEQQPVPVRDILASAPRDQAGGRGGLTCSRSIA
jgi:ferredoxin